MEQSDNNNDGAADNQLLRSVHSHEKAHLVFINTTQRFVNIIWINYQGGHIKYSTIEPYGRKIINTFTTHPWIFKDAYTGEVMHVNQNKVCWPKPIYFIMRPNLHTGEIPQNAPIRLARRNVLIHFPLRSLKLNALWTIVKRIGCISCIDKLEIPITLKEELSILFEYYAEFSANANNDDTDDE